MTVAADRDLAEAARAAGVLGFVLKNRARTDLVFALGEMDKRRGDQRRPEQDDVAEPVGEVGGAPRVRWNPDNDPQRLVRMSTSSG